jgi:hypothetical protein
VDLSSGESLLSKLGWFPFYPRDWYSDPKLAPATPSARGIWIDLLSAMFIEGTASITGDRFRLAGIARCDPDEIDRFIAQAEEYQFADVIRHETFGNADEIRDETPVKGMVTITSRRLARELKTRELARERLRRFRSKRVSKSGKKSNETRLKRNETQTPSISISNSISNSGSNKRKKKNQSIPLPRDFHLDEKDRAFAKERGVDADRVFPRFVAYHQAKGGLMYDWHAAWRTWVLNEDSWGGQRRLGLNGHGPPEPARPKPIPADQNWKRMMEDYEKGK